MSAITVRPARAGEARLLTDLCLRSKAHWGYDAAFMRQAATGLDVTDDDIAAGEVFVAEDPAGRALGIYALDVDGATVDLDRMFVDPAAIGTGVGRALFAHAVARATTHGCTTMTILADPNAAPFYERMGAVFVRMAPSDTIPGRELPFYHLALRPGESACDE